MSTIVLMLAGAAITLAASSGIGVLLGRYAVNEIRKAA
jgi:hypothetical protein